MNNNNISSSFFQNNITSDENYTNHYNNYNNSSIQLLNENKHHFSHSTPNHCSSLTAATATLKNQSKNESI
jgi:hypothetical protein